MKARHCERPRGRVYYLLKQYQVEVVQDFFSSFSHPKKSILICINGVTFRATVEG